MTKCKYTPWHQPLRSTVTSLKLSVVQYFTGKQNHILTMRLINDFLITMNGCFPSSDDPNDFFLINPKGNVHPFLSHILVSISAVVSLPSAFYKDMTSHPAANNPSLWQSFYTRGAGGRRWPRALRFDLLLSSRSSFLFFLLRRISTWIDFHLFGGRHVSISFIRDYDENHDGSHRTRQEEQNERKKKNTREWLTRSQSTFRKNGWPMMSAKPVWGWQPRRSLGSCGSEGERRVREGRGWWWKRRKVRRRGKEMWRRREFARNV